MVVVVVVVVVVVFVVVVDVVVFVCVFTYKCEPYKFRCRNNYGMLQILRKTKNIVNAYFKCDPLGPEKQTNKHNGKNNFVSQK